MYASVKTDYRDVHRDKAVICIRQRKLLWQGLGIQAVLCSPLTVQIYPNDPLKFGHKPFYWGCADLLKDTLHSWSRKYPSRMVTPHDKHGWPDVSIL